MWSRSSEKKLAQINLLTLSCRSRIRGVEFVLEEGQAFSLFDNGDETGFQIGDKLPGMMVRIPLE